MPYLAYYLPTCTVYPHFLSFSLPRFPIHSFIPSAKPVQSKNTNTVSNKYFGLRSCGKVLHLNNERLPSKTNPLKTVTAIDLLPSPRRRKHSSIQFKPGYLSEAWRQGQHSAPGNNHTRPSSYCPQLPWMCRWSGDA